MAIRPRRPPVVNVPTAPGQHIYAYCNIKTKQVLYSLTRTLQSKHLQQLPDAGANNTPPSLRKDLWRPLWSLQLPDGEEGAAQGLQAYKMLRDFRVLHETTWEPPKSMSVPYTAKQIETLEEHLEQRGGSKKESPYDLIRRKKWKMRVRMVMNQKTNSIADLAAVLLKQDRNVEAQMKKRDAVWRAEVAEMEALADAMESSQGKARTELEMQIKEWRDQRAARKTQDRRWRKLNSKIDAGIMRLGKIDWAVEHVPVARKEARAAWIARAEEIKKIAEERRRLAAEKAAAAAAAAANQEAEQQPTAAVEEDDAEDPTSQSASRRIRGKRLPKQTVAPAPEPEPIEDLSPAEIITTADFLPPYPPTLVLAPLRASQLSRDPKSAPAQHIPPVFPAGGEGVTVRWANTLDAEYAEEWPEHVRHEPMGIVRNTAPVASEQEPVLEVGEFKALGWKSRKEGFAIEEGLAEKIARRRKEMGMVEHSSLKNKFTRGEGAVVEEPVVEAQEVVVSEAVPTSEAVTTVDGVAIVEDQPVAEALEATTEGEPIVNPSEEGIDPIAAAEAERDAKLQKLSKEILKSVSGSAPGPRKQQGSSYPLVMERTAGGEDLRV